MKIVHHIEELRQTLAPFQRPAFVPTMGNLHAGHIALVEQARPLGDVTVASAAGTISSTTMVAPASCSASASWRSCAPASSPRPCTR